MKKVILYIASSIDGLIADKDNSTNWLHDPDYSFEGEDFGFTDLMESIDTIFMGNKTMEAILGFDIPFPYKGKKVYVVTRTPESKSHPEATYISDWKTELENLKSQGGKDIWLIGGGQLNTAFLDHSMIDKLIITIIPCSLGQGTPLFPNSKALNKFKLESSKSYGNGMVQLTYVPD